MLRFRKVARAIARFVERSWAIARKWLAARADSILLRNGEQEVKPLAEPTPMDVGGSADRAAPTEESSAAPIAPAGQGAGHVSELEGWAEHGEALDTCCSLHDTDDHRPAVACVPLLCGVCGRAVDVYMN